MPPKLGTTPAKSARGKRPGADSSSGAGGVSGSLTGTSAPGARPGRARAVGGSQRRTSTSGSQANSGSRQGTATSPNRQVTSRSGPDTGGATRDTTAPSAGAPTGRPAEATGSTAASTGSAAVPPGCSSSPTGSVADPTIGTAAPTGNTVATRNGAIGTNRNSETNVAASQNNAERRGRADLPVRQSRPSRRRRNLPGEADGRTAPPDDAASTPTSPSGVRQQFSTGDNAATGTSGPCSAAAAAPTASDSSPRAARSHRGAPPSYEESVNHLTLEYGGYFVPYEARPITTPLTSVPNLSFSQMNMHGRPVRQARGSRNSVTPAHRRVQERAPHGRRGRRVGDLAITASDRVVMTEPIIRDLEEAEDDTNDKCTRLLLPPMHICMATTCLVFNCVIPGSGTLVAAFGLFCCTKPSEWSCGQKTASCCLCLLVALAQLILTPVLLIGWIWSILWGFAYVGVSHQEYHGIKDDEDEEDELATIASGQVNYLSELEDDNPPWALGYQRFDDHPGSAPSRRRMSLANAAGSEGEADAARRHASMLRATRSYGYVEMHGLHGLYGDQQRATRARLQRPTGSVSGSSGTINNNRPLSQTTLTSYINDGMLLNSNPQPTPPRTHPPSMVTVDM